MNRTLFHIGLILFEVVALTLIIQYVAYTEIDWIAYMQEVGGVINGELDYIKLKGDTGPLVYPAGFVWLYSALYAITDAGANIALAQWIFAGFYLIELIIVLLVYAKAKVVPWYYVALLVISKRIHSIFVLRLFNDALAMLFAYLAIFLFLVAIDRQRQRDADEKSNKTAKKIVDKEKSYSIAPMWIWGCIIYSVAVSIKMNIFLFAPALFVILCKNMSFVNVVLHLGICGVVQVVLAIPFLLHNWYNYLTKAFELSRVFTYKWTVNFKWLPEEVFVDPRLGKLLLGLTLLSWLVLYVRRWRHRNLTTNTTHIVATLFESNMIGLAFSRTHHYQFYVWFFHQIPFLLFYSCYASGWLMLDDNEGKKGQQNEKDKSWFNAKTLSLYVFHVALLGSIELAFNVYPSTWWSSGLLTAVMAVIVLMLLFTKDRHLDEKTGKKE